MARSPDYTEFKNKIADQLLESFYKKFPLAKGKEIFHRTSSPLTNEYYINSPEGSCYGLKSIPKKFLNWDYFRMSSDFNGLYLTGQDLFSHGIFGAYWSGFFTAAVIYPKLFITLVYLSIAGEPKKK